MYNFNKEIYGISFAIAVLLEKSFSMKKNKYFVLLMAKTFWFFVTLFIFLHPVSKTSFLTRGGT